MTNLKLWCLVLIFSFLGCGSDLHHVDGNTVFRYHPGDKVRLLPERLQGFNNCDVTVLEALDFAEGENVVYHLGIKCSNGVIAEYNISENHFVRR